MSKIPCPTVGRSDTAVIRLSHETVSRIHAEVIPLPDGRLYITDCASRNGTFICDGGADGQWREINQDFASPGARLRFGEVEMTVPHLQMEISRMRAVGSAGSANGPPAGQAVVRQAEKLDASQGVALDPKTGEPVGLASTADEGKA